MSMVVILVTSFVLLLQCHTKHFIFQHNLNILITRDCAKCSTGMLIQLEVMYLYIMIMAAILTTILAHCYDVEKNPLNNDAHNII